MSPGVNGCETVWGGKSVLHGTWVISSIRRYSKYLAVRLFRNEVVFEEVMKRCVK